LQKFSHESGNRWLRSWGKNARKRAWQADPKGTPPATPLQTDDLRWWRRRGTLWVRLRGASLSQFLTRAAPIGTGAFVGFCIVPRNNCSMRKESY